MRIHGHCHCGNVAFELDWLPDPATIPARACGCTFCTRHGGVWTACAGGKLHVLVRDASKVTRYAFGTKTAEFHICAVCGIVPLVISRMDGRDYAVVNVNTFDGVDPALLQRTGVSFDDEDEATRLARRRRNWIAEVDFVETPHA
jgi:hypothetical protein